MELTELEQDRLETAAMIVHDRSHWITLGRSCDRCRETARQVARLLWGVTERDNPPPAA